MNGKRLRGEIVKIVADRGFAFVRDTNGVDRFIHADTVIPPEDFHNFAHGTTVEFDPVFDPARGNRAINVGIINDEAEEDFQEAEESVEERQVRLQRRFAPKGLMR